MIVLEVKYRTFSPVILRWTCRSLIVLEFKNRTYRPEKVLEVKYWTYRPVIVLEVVL